jgi:energy-converting hydrogenase Eha subunit A
MELPNIITAAVILPFFVNTAFPIAEQRHERALAGKIIVLIALMAEALTVISLASVVLCLGVISPWAKAAVLGFICIFHCASIISYRRSGAFVNFQTIQYFSTSSRDLIAHSTSLPTSKMDGVVIASAVLVVAFMMYELPNIMSYKLSAAFSRPEMVLALIVLLILLAHLINLKMKSGDLKGIIGRSLSYAVHHTGPFLNLIFNEMWRVNERVMLHQREERGRN